jgi:hypothetical protein
MIHFGVPNVRRALHPEMDPFDRPYVPACGLAHGLTSRKKPHVNCGNCKRTKVYQHGKGAVTAAEFFYIPVEHTEYGHITQKSHEKAQKLALKAGVWAGQQFTIDYLGRHERILRVLSISLHWSGRPQAYVENVETGRKGRWFVESIVKLFKEPKR